MSVKAATINFEEAHSILFDNRLVDVVEVRLPKQSCYSRDYHNV